jgi:hypothetical protein
MKRTHENEQNSWKNRKLMETMKKFMENCIEKCSQKPQARSRRNQKPEAKAQIKKSPPFRIPIWKFCSSAFFILPPIWSSD